MFSLNNKKTLVTGVGGFIGSRLCAQLINQGVKVTALTYYNSLSTYGNLDFLKDGEIESYNTIIGNIEDPYFIDYASVNINIIGNKESNRSEKSDVFNLIFDNTRAKDKISCLPTGSFTKGLERIIHFIKNYQDFNKIDKYEI